MNTGEKKAVVHFDAGKPHHWFAFWLGSGLMPKAPGTWGTLAAIPLYLLLEAMNLPVTAYVALTLGLFLIGIPICGKAGRELGVHDHSAIVWDEVVGFLVTMTAAPDGWEWVLLGFLLFRVFDIFKPWPISWLDRQVSGGLGVMLDDLLAGLFALVIMHIVVLTGWL